MSNYYSAPSNDSPYWIYSPLDVRQIFRFLERKKERVVLVLGVSEFIVSNVLHVSDAGELYLDLGAEKALNQKIVLQGSALGVSAADKVDIKWQMQNISFGRFEGYDCLVTKIPERVHKLQRREFYRVVLNSSNSLMCSIPWEFKDQYDNPQIRVKTSRVLDISLGGVRLLEPAFGNVLLDTGLKMKNCSIVLPDFGRLEFSLIIKHIYKDTKKDLFDFTGLQIGCAFEGLSHAGETAVQKYMGKVERERALMKQS